jgi:cytochrome c oxidase subunit II
MARKLTVSVPVALVLALAGAGAAFAAPGGLGPPGPDTPSGQAISRLYWIVLGLCGVVFVLVETALILFIVRFRRRRDTPESAEGPQIHGNTRLEIIWTAIPAIILAALAIFTFTQIPAVQAQGIEDESHLTVRVEAHQFYWEYRYPDGETTVNTLYLPVDEPVELELTGMDVIHSWWVPALTGKMDAIPGRINSLRFVPESTGDFEGKCAELCGVQHAFMRQSVRVVGEETYVHADHGHRPRPERLRVDARLAAGEIGAREGNLGGRMRHVSRPERPGRRGPVDRGERHSHQQGRPEGAARERAEHAAVRVLHAARRARMAS